MIDHTKRRNLVDSKIENVSNLDDDKNFFWFSVDGEEKIATENLVPGKQVYNEKLLLKKGIEYRLWDPFRSKLASAIIKGFFASYKTLQKNEVPS